MRRRNAFWLPMALVMLPTAKAAVLPAATALDKDLARALASGRPLLVMVSLEGCPFCRTVRDSHLGPLAAETGQPIVQVDLGSNRVLSDFDGLVTTHAELARRWKVEAAPTVIFVGPGGREAAPRLAGASIPDFYGAYLQQRLDAAVVAVRRASSMRTNAQGSRTVLA